jgi:hypothetical protein
MRSPLSSSFAKQPFLKLLPDVPTDSADTLPEGAMHAAVMACETIERLPGVSFCGGSTSASFQSAVALVRDCAAGTSEDLTAETVAQSFPFHKEVLAKCGNLLRVVALDVVDVGKAHATVKVGKAAMDYLLDEMRTKQQQGGVPTFTDLKRFRQFRWLLTREEDLEINKAVSVYGAKRSKELLNPLGSGLGLADDDRGLAAKGQFINATLAKAAVEQLSEVGNAAASSGQAAASSSGPAPFPEDRKKGPSQKSLLDLFQCKA